MGKFDDLPEARRRGLEKMEKVYGFDMTDGEGDFFAYTADHLFGDIWSRPGLSDRDRRLLLIGMLSAPGGTDVLEIQVPAALSAGELDPAELREIVVFICHYAGWPVGAKVNSIVENAIAKAAPGVTSRYASLSREELAGVVPELLLIGQLIDRSGMAWCIQAFGREEMAQIAIDEWASSSPVYTRRMQRALGYAAPPGEGDVVTIFKGLQLDIGAPPQFMDFRYTVEDPLNGSFELAHCGALMDVEPMGPDYVRSMCHDIEDPTFDATAVASNPRAQVRPIHRPPRTPEGRNPHCAWTVRISPDHPPVAAHPGLAAVEATRAATLPLDPIDPSSTGASDYSGPLVDDFDFASYSHSALVRIADEVCLQMHLLVQGFRNAVRERDAAREPEITTRQLVGIAGVAASRLRSALGLPGTEEAALRVLELHPLLNPAAYVVAAFEPGSLRVSPGPAHEDGAWIALVGPSSIRPLASIVQAVDPHLDVAVTGEEGEWTATLVRHEEPQRPPDEVAVTRFSSGADWEFETRRSLPIWPVTSP